MDLDKVDRLHRAITSDLFVMSVDEQALGAESLLAAQRLYAYLLAGYVYQQDASPEAMRQEVEAYGREVVVSALAQLQHIGSHHRDADEEHEGDDDGF
jgi:hypothetical protein